MAEPAPSTEPSRRSEWHLGLLAFYRAVASKGSRSAEPVWRTLAARLAERWPELALAAVLLLAGRLLFSLAGFPAGSLPYLAELQELGRGASANPFDLTASFRSGTSTPFALWLAAGSWCGLGGSLESLLLWSDVWLAAGMIFCGASMRRLGAGTGSVAAALLLFLGAPLVHAVATTLTEAGALFALMAALGWHLLRLSSPRPAGPAFWPIAWLLLAGGMAVSPCLAPHAAGLLAGNVLLHAWRRKQSGRAWLWLLAVGLLGLGLPVLAGGHASSSDLWSRLPGPWAPGALAAWWSESLGTASLLASCAGSMPAVLLAAGLVLATAFWRAELFPFAVSVLAAVAAFAGVDGTRAELLLPAMPGLLILAAAGFQELERFWRELLVVAALAAAAIGLHGTAFGPRPGADLVGPVPRWSGEIELFGRQPALAESLLRRAAHWSRFLDGTGLPKTVAVHPLEVHLEVRSEQFELLRLRELHRALGLELAGYGWHGHARFLRDLDTRPPLFLVFSERLARLDEGIARKWLEQAGPPQDVEGSPASNAPDAAHHPHALDRIGALYAVIETRLEPEGAVWLLVRRDAWEKASCSVPLLWLPPLEPAGPAPAPPSDASR